MADADWMYYTIAQTFEGANNDRVCLNYAGTSWYMPQHYLSNTYKKFNATTSLRLNYGGNYHEITPIRTQDFYISFWFYTTNSFRGDIWPRFLHFGKNKDSGATTGLIIHGGNGYGNGSMFVGVEGNGANWYASSGGLNNGQWYFFEFSRVSNVGYLFINGTLQNAGGTACAQNFTDYWGNVGCNSIGTERVDNTWLEQLIICVGKGGHTANYTPPTQGISLAPAPAPKSDGLPFKAATQAGTPNFSGGVKIAELADTIARYPCTLYRGPGFVSGTVKEGTVLKSRRVRLYDRDTGRLVASTMSADDGSYLIQGVDPSRQYIAMAVDDDAGVNYDPAAIDRVAPARLYV